MIIFDTNALDLLSPQSPRADIIRKLRESSHHRVAVPWMVLEELSAHQTKHYPDKYNTVVNTLDRLRQLLPWELTSSLEPLDVERFLDHWRGIYSEIFEVIETSDEAARKALAREAMALKPAKRAKDHSEGARDAAIWFSILDFLKEHPDEHVCFVTANTQDFGDGMEYPYPMNEDVSGLEHRLSRLTDFNEVVSQFTKEVSGETAVAEAEELLRSRRVRQLVAQTAVDVLASPAGYPGLDGSGSAAVWSSWLGAPDVDLLSVTDVTGHEIEGDVWYTAKANWLLYGGAFGGDGESLLDVAVIWDMKVLFSTDDDGDAKPTLLTEGAPTPPDTADDRCMEVLRQLKERAARAAQKAVDVLGVAGTAARAASFARGDAAAKAAMSVFNPSILEAQRAMAASFPKLDIATTAALQAVSVINPSIFEAQRAIAKQLAIAKPQLDIASTAAARIAAATPIIDPTIFEMTRRISAQIAAMPAYRFATTQAAFAPDTGPDAEEDEDATEEENADE